MFHIVSRCFFLTAHAMVHLASADAAAVGYAACLQPLQGHLHNPPARNDRFLSENGRHSQNLPKTVSDGL